MFYSDNSKSTQLLTILVIGLAWRDSFTVNCVMCTNIAHLSLNIFVIDFIETFEYKFILL